MNSGEGADTGEGAGKRGAGKTDGAKGGVDNIAKIIGEDIAGTNLDPGSGRIRIKDFNFDRVIIDDDIGGVGSAGAGVKNDVEVVLTVLNISAGGGTEAKGGGKDGGR